MSHLKTHNIKVTNSNSTNTNLNHGFRSGFSTETQLLTSINKHLTSLDKPKQIYTAILNFSKDAVLYDCQLWCCQPPPLPHLPLGSGPKHLAS